MPYVLKVKKGVKYISGRKSRGGCLRTAGGRVQVFEKKSTAQNAKDQIINRWVKEGTLKKEEKQKVKNRIVIKQI
jgi:hypothetical protein